MVDDTTGGGRKPAAHTHKFDRIQMESGEMVTCRTCGRARDDTRGGLASFRVSFTVEYESFIEAPADADGAFLLARAEEDYAEGADWVLVSHSIVGITEVTDD